MINYLTLGIVLGLSAGLSPGPLFALVISETLSHHIGAGIRVAISPLLTDLPVIILTVFILSRLSGFHSILGMISLVGGAVIFMMGLQSLRFRGAKVDTSQVQQRSLTKGMLVNILSPHPYLFWFSVGAPTLTRAYNEKTIFAISFILCFYIFLIGAKMSLAILVGKSKKLLTGSVYIYTMRSLGLLLILFSLILVKDGLQLLNIL